MTNILADRGCNLLLFFIPMHPLDLQRPLRACFIKSSSQSCSYFRKSEATSSSSSLCTQLRYQKRSKMFSNFIHWVDCLVLNCAHWVLFWHKGLNAVFVFQMSTGKQKCYIFSSVRVLKLEYIPRKMITLFNPAGHFNLSKTSVSSLNHSSLSIGVWGFLTSRQSQPTCHSAGTSGCALVWLMRGRDAPPSSRCAPLCRFSPLLDSAECGASGSQRGTNNYKL